MAGHKFTEEQKSKFRFEAWLRNNEETLTILMKDPKKWEFCKKHIILPKIGPQAGRECSLDSLALLVQMVFHPEKAGKAPETLTIYGGHQGQGE